ncbi:MAG TPA: hypothetical protein VEN81_01470, partial [Planctomycetota bacterium]|nr:hypothetical protein [Planctomycetota bacterium]
LPDQKDTGVRSNRVLRVPGASNEDRRGGPEMFGGQHAERQKAPSLLPGRRVGALDRMLGPSFGDFRIGSREDPKLRVARAPFIAKETWIVGTAEEDRTLASGSPFLQFPPLLLPEGPKPTKSVFAILAGGFVHRFGPERLGTEGFSSGEAGIGRVGHGRVDLGSSGVDRRGDRRRRRPLGPNAPCDGSLGGVVLRFASRGKPEESPRDRNQEDTGETRFSKALEAKAHDFLNGEPQKGFR